MTRRLVLSEEAKGDIAEAATWYARQRAGLEDEFLQEIENALARIEANPEASSYIHGELRQAIVHRFPYLIIYDLTDVAIGVIAIMHGSRNPDTWMRRL